MMKLFELFESPISCLEIDSSFDSNEKSMIDKRHGYSRELDHWSKVDKKAINDINNKDKIIKRFAGIKNNINLYFYHHDDPNYDPIFQYGLADMNWIKAKMGNTVAENIEKWKQSDAINIVITNNLSDESPMSFRSSWTLAHRIAHVMLSGKEGKDELGRKAMFAFENFIMSIMKLGYNWNLDFDAFDYFGHHGYYMRKEQLEWAAKTLGHSIGTMKSARNGKLVNGYEWYHETFAQFLLTGKITFNSLPKEINDDQPLTNDPNKLKQINRIMYKFPKKLELEFSKILDNAVGKIWIM